MRTTFTRPHLPRALALVAVLGAALLLSGCGLSQRKVLSGVSQDVLSSGQEPYFDVGGVTYQIQESRQLNPYSNTDVQFLTGLKGAQQISGSDFWLGIFLWAKNQHRQTLNTASKFVLTDSAGNSYNPTPLNPNINPFAWTSTALGRDDIEPSADSIAGQGPVGGGLIIFDLPQSAYQNRPLTLHIYAPGSSTAGAVSLDL